MAYSEYTDIDVFVCLYVLTVWYTVCVCVSGVNERRSYYTHKTYEIQSFTHSYYGCLFSAVPSATALYHP